METPTSSVIRIGISSCLLGAKVRFDSGHKKNAYITGVLHDFFEFIPFCPEVEIGMGVPRETIRLVRRDDEVRCVGTKSENLDVTEQLYDIAEKQQDWHRDICGYILKRDSPSCGMERVKLYHNNMPQKSGVGIYARRLMQNFPHLPIEEEGRLEDANLRENFIRRVYVYARWKEMLAQGLSLPLLQTFHANHKYIFMSHHQLKAKALGALLAVTGKVNVQALGEQYLSDMMSLLKMVASRNNHVNTLQHIQGYLKEHLDGDDKAELSAVISDYRQGLIPIIVPITLLRHHFRRHPHDYITQSYYMRPHPGEMMLLNNI